MWTLITAAIGIAKSNWRSWLIIGGGSMLIGAAGGWWLAGVFEDASQAKQAKETQKKMENAHEIQNDVRRRADGAALIELRRNWSRQ